MSKNWNIIPIPSLLQYHSNEKITLDQLIINHDRNNLQVTDIAGYLRDWIDKYTPVRSAKSEDYDLPAKTINLRLDTNKNLPVEGNYLDTTGKDISISASSASGLFYGVQSFLQLISLPPSNNTPLAERSTKIPGLKIEDHPLFGWRGMHLDVSRHFFPKEYIFKYLDLLAKYKFNKFHWHLTDDQGWRIEIKRYPELTEKSAWRKQTTGDGKPHGGFYTQEDIKDIVDFAGQRFIEVIPEIEMPGHSMAALAAFPELSCTGRQTEVPTEWGIYHDVYCAGNDKTFEFLENVLSEVFELFPGKYIHIGGDECPKKRWEKCPKCQKRMRDEKLHDFNQLQGYFVGRIGEFLVKNGKTLIGWDEILDGELPDSAIVMAWRGINKGIEAVKRGFDTVLCPVSHCYFDYYQGKTGEPKAFDAYLPLKKVYSFNPIPEGINSSESKKILGVQGNVWTEYMPDWSQVEYMLLPRMCALAEVAWSDPSKRGYKDFMKRLETHLQRFDLMDINYRKPKEDDL